MRTLDDEIIRDGETLRVPMPLFLMDAARRGYDLDLDLDDRIVEDGETVRVPMMILDAARDHQPGYRVSAASESRNFRDLDALRDAARRERTRWISRMGDAWKTGPLNRTNLSEVNQSALSERHEPDNSSSLAQWREHRGEPDDASEPDTGSRPWELAAHERGEPDHDLGAAMARHQRRRDDAWSRYRDNLGQAWRNRGDYASVKPRIVGAGPKSMVVDPGTGRSDPGAATEIEKQRREWHGGR
jgi:hypothetical protein